MSLNPNDIFNQTTEIRQIIIKNMSLFIIESIKRFF